MFGDSALLESNHSLTIDWSMEQVFEYFSEQITDQEWQLDTQGIGQVTTSGIWTKSLETDLNLIGTLNVFSRGDSNFDLKFTLRTP